MAANTNGQKGLVAHLEDDVGIRRIAGQLFEEAGFSYYAFATWPAFCAGAPALKGGSRNTYYVLDNYVDGISRAMDATKLLLGHDVPASRIFWCSTEQAHGIPDGVTFVEKLNLYDLVETLAAAAKQS